MLELVNRKLIAMLFHITVDLLAVILKIIRLVEQYTFLLFHHRITETGGDHSFAFPFHQNGDNAPQLPTHLFKQQNIVCFPEGFTANLPNECDLLLYLWDICLFLKQGSHVLQLLFCRSKRGHLLHVGKNQPIHKVVKPFCVFIRVL